MARKKSGSVDSVPQVTFRATDDSTRDTYFTRGQKPRIKPGDTPLSVGHWPKSRKLPPMTSDEVSAVGEYLDLVGFGPEAERQPGTEWLTSLRQYWDLRKTKQ